MDIKEKEIEYQLSLEEAETIEILINGNSVFSETVPTDFKANINFKYREVKK